MKAVFWSLIMLPYSVGQKHRKLPFGYYFNPLSYLLLVRSLLSAYESLRPMFYKYRSYTEEDRIAATKAFYKILTGQEASERE